MISFAQLLWKTIKLGCNCYWWHLCSSCNEVHLYICETPGGTNPQTTLELWSGLARKPHNPHGPLRIGADFHRCNCSRMVTFYVVHTINFSPLLPDPFYSLKGNMLVKVRSVQTREGRHDSMERRQRIRGEERKRRENHIVVVYNRFLINMSASAKSLINFYSSHSFLANTANSRCSLKHILGWHMTPAPLLVSDIWGQWHPA